MGRHPATAIGRLLDTRAFCCWMFGMGIDRSVQRGPWRRSFKIHNLPFFIDEFFGV